MRLLVISRLVDFLCFFMHTLCVLQPPPYLITPSFRFIVLRSDYQIKLKGLKYLILRFNCITFFISAFNKYIGFSTIPFCHDEVHHFIKAKKEAFLSNGNNEKTHYFCGYRFFSPTN
jgi:hypothetical protein